MWKSCVVGGFIDQYQILNADIATCIPMV